MQSELQLMYGTCTCTGTGTGIAVPRVPVPVHLSIDVRYRYRATRAHLSIAVRYRYRYRYRRAMRSSSDCCTVPVLVPVLVSVLVAQQSECRPLIIRWILLIGNKFSRAMMGAFATHRLDSSNCVYSGNLRYNGAPRAPF